MSHQTSDRQSGQASIPFDRHPDVYFTAPYIRLHCPSDGEIENFRFGSQGDSFEMALIRRPVPDQFGGANFFDFETPYGYAGPLATTTAPEFLSEAWASFSNYCENKRIIAGFIRFHPMIANERFAQSPHLKVITDRATVLLDLTRTAGDVEASYASHHRRAIRKAKKAGITTKITSGIDSLEVFARLYKARMLEIDARDEYFFGEDYFRAIHDFGPGTYRLYFAYKDGEPVGGVLVLIHGRYAHYHLAASLGAFMPFAPSHLICDTLIKDLLKEPQELLHFGGGRTNDPEDGLLRFKAGFSPARAQFQIGKYLANFEAYQSICARWVELRPEQAARYGAFFLKYRY